MRSLICMSTEFCRSLGMEQTVIDLCEGYRVDTMHRVVVSARGVFGENAGENQGAWQGVAIDALDGLQASHGKESRLILCGMVDLWGLAARRGIELITIVAPASRELHMLMDALADGAPAYMGPVGSAVLNGIRRYSSRRGGLRYLGRTVAGTGIVSESLQETVQVMSDLGGLGNEAVTVQIGDGVWAVWRSQALVDKAAVMPEIDAGVLGYVIHLEYLE